MLTDLLIKKLPLPEKRREIPDGKVPGLFLIHQPSGTRSWAFRYHLLGGATAKLTIGPYPAVSVAAARRRAEEARGEVAAGRDPASLKQASRAAAKAEREVEVDLVERVVEQFIERHAKPNTRDWRETERILVREVIVRWKGRRLSHITRAHVHEMLDQIIDRGARIRANRVFAQFRKMCRWAISRGIIDRNPCEGLSAPSQETSRDRVLTDDEIRLVWGACERLGWPFGPIVLLLLLTGARRDEVASMRWSEIDLAGRMWTLPKERTKNKRPHEVPLSDAVISVLRALPRIQGNDGLVFSTTGKTPVSGFSRAKTKIDAAILERLRDDAEANGRDPQAVEAPPHWTFHDLRRTVATNLQRLGVKLEVTESILNHVSGSRAGLVGIYQRHEFTSEKRDALAAWARRLDSIINGTQGASVVELRARA
jgi:integrase